MRSLDGLRGVAALVVVLGHARLVALQNIDSPLFQLPGIRHALELLALLGAHSVWLFFVLSGLVLSRMMLSTANFDYGNYVLGRLARLYIPVWAAVALTAVSMLLIPRDSPGLGPWVDAHPDTYLPSAIVNDLLLITGSTGNLSPLWSLQWEILFSVLLILYTACLQKVPPLVGLPLTIALCIVGQQTDNQALMYMSMFAVGTALAIAWDQLTAIRDRVEERMRNVWPLYVALLMVACVLIIALQILPRLLAKFGVPDLVMSVGSMVSTMVALAGAIVLVGLATPLRAVFEIRAIQWLGLISFSLYLVHEPVLLAAVYLFRGDPVAIAVGLLLCFPIARLFYWAVEKPSHRFSRRFSRSKLPVEPVPTTAQ
ncbi:acyltransferase [Leifsonia kafniensis]|uniref:Acyltransferase n=1 Tax=Leifsonia kafniensis TaxID=475957 RepID=A0ABP7KVR1_9MICO